MHKRSAQVNACLSLALILLLATGCATKHTDSPTGIATSTKIAPILASAARQLQAKTAATPFNGLVRSDAEGRLEIYVFVDSVSPAVVTALRARGLENSLASPSMRIVQGWAKPQSLDSLAALPFVIRITPPHYAHPR